MTTVAALRRTNGMAFSCRERAARDHDKKDTVLFVKQEFASLSLSTSDDRMQPAHNKPYQYYCFGHSISAVPLGCGQLASGVGCRHAHCHLQWVLLRAGACFGLQFGPIRGIEWALLLHY